MNYPTVKMNISHFSVGWWVTFKLLGMCIGYSQRYFRVVLKICVQFQSLLWLQYELCILIMHASHSVSYMYISGERITSDNIIQVFSRSTGYRWPTFIGCGYKTRDTLQVMLFAYFYMPIQCKCITIDWRLWGDQKHSMTLIGIHPLLFQLEHLCVTFH